MSKDIVKFNLQEITIQRKNLSIKTLHDNLISKTKISKYNKKSSKYKFIIPNTNREVFKWGSELGHCLGTAGMAKILKKMILLFYTNSV